MTTEKPLATFILCAYNQEKYVTEAVIGALSQTYSPLQIIFSDDCSTDNTFEIMSNIISNYDGPHKITLNKNSSNLGIGAHINRLMELAEGDYIIASAGDDISDKERTEVIMNAFMNSEKPTYSIWSKARYIDSNGFLVDKEFPGNTSDYTEISISRNIKPLIGATHAWHRDTFSFFGPLMPEVVFEDNAISFRSFLLGNILYIDKCLVSYRTHQANLTNFEKNIDFLKLLATETKWMDWSHTAVAQRIKDLEIAKAKTPSNRRNYNTLLNELKKMESNFKRRLNVYKEFPILSISSAISSIRNPRILKLIIRLFLLKKNSGK